jgi:hypothetical protein
MASPLVLLIVAPVPEERRPDLCVVLQGRLDGCARASGGLVLSAPSHAPTPVAGTGPTVSSPRMLTTVPARRRCQVRGRSGGRHIALSTR